MKKESQSKPQLLLGAVAAAIICGLAGLVWWLQMGSPSPVNPAFSGVSDDPVTNLAPAEVPTKSQSIKSDLNEHGVVRESGATFTFATSSTGQPPFMTEVEFIARREQRSRQ
jgi:hypothetical protein